MTEPNKIITPPYETVTLAGKEWPVPLLGPRQNRIIAPLALKLLREFRRYFPPGWKAGDDPSLVDFDLSTSQIDDLVEIIWLGLSRAHKEITKDEVMDMPISPPEMLAALNTIAKQTGIIVPAKKNGVAQPGEAVAESHPTGTG